MKPHAERSTAMVRTPELVVAGGPDAELYDIQAAAYR